MTWNEELQIKDHDYLHGYSDGYKDGLTKGMEEVVKVLGTQIRPIVFKVDKEVYKNFTLNDIKEV